MPKPLAAERLAKALQRLQGGRREGHLAVTLAGQVDLVAVGSVLAIHGADDYSELETVDGARHLHKKTLSQLERLLPPEFARVHRSHIVNRRHANGLASESGARRVVILSNGTAVPVGRAYAERLRKRML